MARGPRRWDQVNIDLDRRYFDVSENIMDTGASSGLVSLSEKEPMGAANKTNQ
jgi:hypothetical protein